MPIKKDSIPAILEAYARTKWKGANVDECEVADAFQSFVEDADYSDLLSILDSVKERGWPR